MNPTAELVFRILAGAICLAAVVALLIRTLKRSDDPARLVFKWLLTAGVIGFMAWKVAPMVAEGGYGGAFGGIPLAAVCGLALAIIWRHSIAGVIAKPFGALYDGGDVPPEPAPAYSVAQARRKQAKYLQAVAEIRKQLDQFPNDLEGHMLLAQIQAEDLKDLPGAEITVHRFCAQPGHAPRNIVFALYSLADWHLQIGQDREAAKRALDKVIELLPDSEFSLSAAQRIAHLTSREMLLEAHDPRKLALTEGDQHLGLLQSTDHLKPPESDPTQAAAEYVKHLEQHPLDTEAREKLAVIYAGHYGRLDLAAAELEQLITQPNQPARLVVHWLNLLADLQIQAGTDYDTVRQTIERIIELYPNLAAAELARNRLAHLKLELKAKDKNQAVKLGTYEQNIGLRMGKR